jgi:hypothetical protein
MASERDRPPTPIRTSCRRFVRAASATGALVASSYVKPNLHSLGVTGALAAVSGGGYQGGGNNQDGNSQGDNKGKGGK